MDVFTSFSGEPVVLPDRFAALKRHICTDPERMMHSWQGLLRELEGAVEEVAEKGAEVGLPVLGRNALYNSSNLRGSSSPRCRTPT